MVLASCFVAGWFILLADEYKQLGKHIAGGAGFISNFILWNESGYFDNIAETKPLLHLWSLGVEEQFYVIWPLLLWFAWKQRWNFLLIAIVVGVISFVLNVYAVRVSTGAVSAFYSPQTRFWELMAGAVLSYLILHRQDVLLKIKSWPVGQTGIFQSSEAPSKMLCDLLSALGIVLIATGITVITKNDSFPGYWALFPIVGAAAIIAAGSKAWLNRVVLSNRVLVWFGLISFPLYLWHWPLLSFARIMEGGTPSYQVRIAAVIASIALAWLTYKLLENPLRFGGRGQTKAIALFMSMAVIGFVGYNCYERDGLGFRLSKLGFRLPKTMQTLVWTPRDAESLGKELEVGSCLLNPDQSYTGFDSCRPWAEKENKPLIYLWGDSYAAHLYPGYKSVFGDDFRIVQRTASACPPIISMEASNRPYCKEINDHILEAIIKTRPEKVVLAADWPEYDWPKVEGTIKRLHNSGIRQVDLVGSFPQWHDSLYKQLYLKFRADGGGQIPYRMQFGLNQNFIKLEPLISSLAIQLGVNYLSPKDIFCDSTGCITRLGETGDTLTTYDAAHLTPMASRYLVSHFKNNQGVITPSWKP